MRTRDADDSAAAPSPGIGPNNTPLETYALPPRELAAAIGLPPETLDALCRHKKGPPLFKIGRRWFCRRSDFHAWLDDCASGKIDATLVEKRRHVAPLLGHNGGPPLDSPAAAQLEAAAQPAPRRSKEKARGKAKAAGKVTPLRRRKRGEERTGAS
jgi:hypothetical protein